MSLFKNVVVYNFQVDGDTDNLSVQEDFRNIIRGVVEYIQNDKKSEAAHSHSNSAFVSNGNVSNGYVTHPTYAPVETISQKVVNGNAHMTNGVVNGAAKKVANGMANGLANGVPNGLANGVANGIANGVANGVPKALANGVPKGIANGVANATNQSNGYGHNLVNGTKSVAKKISNGGLPSYTSLANDRLSNHNEMNYMDAHI